MATTSINPHQWKYDVFVSFRGEDIRKSFMDHLFNDFKKKEIHAFRDDNELSKGEPISRELDKAIEESRFLLVIFSKTYASSSWCLNELVKILECKRIEEQKHEVRIIFYDVKPKVVRKQTKSYAKAFERHESSNRIEAAKWREALSMAADLSGWDLQEMTNGYEAKFIDSISKEILQTLCHEGLHVGENIVGMRARVDRMNLFRFVRSDKVQMIGICGISGIGKTTLAKAIYNLMHPHFEGSCFCEGVQEKDLTQVQMHLIDNLMGMRDVHISNVSKGIILIQRISKPILLVLDDVDHREQLEALAGSHDWFIPGSLIIFTGKDKQLLRSHKVDEIYDMDLLEYLEALQLFHLYAFGKEHPAPELKELAAQVVNYLQGHPLALKVVGGSLYHKPIDVWKSQLEGLQTHPNADIQKKLRPSFDGLDFYQKRAFLDIACCFIGEKKDFVATVLDSYNCCAKADMEVLIDKSLITVSQNDMSLQMHGLIQSMARKIILEESEIPGMRSRLYIPSEVCDALNENKVTQAVEALVLLLEKPTLKFHIHGKAFAHMKNLRILKICYSKAFLLENFKTNHTERLKFLSNKLSLLCWHGFPFKSLPLDFHPENIVAIDLSYSRIKNIWTKAKCFRRLKVMKLRHCHYVTSTPNFTEITNLEMLYLDDCVNLVNVHPSIGRLNRLIVLSMKNCRCAKRFQCIFEMDSLQVMNLSGCLKVDKFPEFVSTLKNLVELHVDGTAITELPSFVSSQSNLQVLSFGRHVRTESRHQKLSSKSFCLPRKLQHPQSLVIPSLPGLCFLRELNFSHCNIEHVPDSIGGLSCLECLCLMGNDFTSLPASLSHLPRLKSLVLDSCKKLEVLPETTPELWHVSACNCTSLQEVYTPLPGKHGSSIIRYDIRGCPKLLRNIIPIESEEVSISQPQDHATFIASHGSRNKASSFISNILKGCISKKIKQKHLGHKFVDMVFRVCRGIPQGFRNQSKGSDDVKVKLSQSHRFKGYITWVVFAPKKPYTTVSLGYIVKNANGASSQTLSTYSVKIDVSEVHHDTLTWLHFTIDRQGWKEEKDFVIFSFEENEGYEVKEIGVNLISDENELERRGFFLRTKMKEPLYVPPPTKYGGTLPVFVDYSLIFLRW